MLFSANSAVGQVWIDTDEYGSIKYGYNYHDDEVMDAHIYPDSGNVRITNMDTGNWGIVENLQFADGGSGIVTITGFADGSLAGIQADNVDFAFGNISIDLSGIAGIADVYWAFDLFDFEDGFYLSSLLGATTFSGVEDLYSLWVILDEGTVWILNDGVFGAGWSIDAATGFVSWSAADVPEPATLAIIGLGLAGLGLARRRRFWYFATLVRRCVFYAPTLIHKNRHVGVLPRPFITDHDFADKVIAGEIG